MGALPLWAQTPANPADEIEEFYSGADDETKGLRRASLCPPPPTEPEQPAPVPVAERAFRQVPTADLAARRQEWLQLEYERAVPVATVDIHETYNPGAVCKASAVADEAGETILWEGLDSTTQAPGMLPSLVSTPVTARHIKVYLDSPRVNGWNEIDAVELVGRDGTRQWANAATASSTYAERAVQPRR